MNDEALFKAINFIQNAAGAVPGPQDCFLTLRGIKTLALRMERHCDNAERVAAYLLQHPASSMCFPRLARPPGP